MPKAKSRIQVNNKRASFDYEFLETYEAGIVLVGTEIKSIRAGRVSMTDAFCYFFGFHCVPSNVSELAKTIRRRALRLGVSLKLDYLVHKPEGLRLTGSEPAIFG